MTASDRLKVALLTREYPPEVYGGAGVHVEYLARELAPLVDVTVHCQGKPRSTAVAHSPWSLLSEANPALQTISTDLSMVAALDGAQVAHSHTWYANLGGHLGGLLHDIPHVVTVHSLEPLRPWKAEQLGGGYALSSWAEKVSVEGASAIVAVSEGMRADLLSAYPDVDRGKVHVIYNGIDAEQYAPDPNNDVIERYGLPCHTVGMGSKGCVVFSSEPLYEYRDYATKVDEELSTLAWLYHMNHGIFMTPGVDEQWTLSVAQSDDELQRYVDAFEAFARDVTA